MTASPPTPWRIEATKTAVNPTAEPADSQVPASAPATACDTVATTATTANTSHDARCGWVVPRRMSRR